MEIITLNGYIMDEIEKKTDRRGNPYIRFKVCCTRQSNDKTESTTIYRCYSYANQYSHLKRGDMVFLSGDLEVNQKRDQNGKEWFNLDVYVRQITDGK